jgi:two-component system nitrogen regulation response regulator GlnG
VEYPLLSARLRQPAATRSGRRSAGLNRNTLRKKIRDLDIQVIRTSG